jgi:putative DNA primase/helicase
MANTNQAAVSLVDAAAHTEKLLTAAFSYAARGWHVFPCHSLFDGVCGCGKVDCRNTAKHPMTPAGFHDATTDELLIRAWWQKWPLANIAIATGKVSGIVVIDIDSRHSADSFKALFPGIDFKSIPTVTTGRGWHLYFRHPGGTVPSRQGIFPGVDVKADGGYILAPPSIHRSGRFYR